MSESPGFFSSLLGKIFNRGTELELEGGVDFKSPLSATPNASTRLIDIEVDLEEGSIADALDEASHYPILTITAQNTTLGSAHYGKYCVFTHATPNLTLDSGLVAGKLILGHATQGVLTFVDGTATVRKSALWGLTTSGAYAPFAVKVLAADEVHLSGELIDA